MAKDVSMSIKIERELRDEFARAAAEEHRPAAQVMRELMRGFIGSRSHQPNAETIAAIEEARSGTGKRYTSAGELFRELGIPCGK
jgi:hypothetical protein